MKTNLLVVFLLFFLPALSHALGLGNIQTKSGLNEPFEASIELLSATADDLAGLKVELAEPEVFDKFGIERPLILSKLKFGLRETEQGPDYIRVYSIEPIQEPFLNFLVEISWPRGKLFREYTVLLDPPIYAPPAMPISPEPEKTVVPATPISRVEDEDHVVVYDLEYQEGITQARPVTRTPATTRLSAYSGGDYGPTVTGDTLWSIASHMRPDNSVSIQQMMLALLRTNPEAFINNNINGLKKGHILRMPDMSEIQSLAKNEAFNQAKTQNELWERARMVLAETPAPRPVGAETSGEEPVASPVDEAAPVTEAVEVDPELRLVAPTDDGTGVGGEAGEIDAEADEALKQELALVSESLEALTLENAELEEKLVESEEIITDLRQLIALKEDELNTLEEQIKAAAAMEAAETAEATPVEEVIEEPAAEVAEVVPAEEETSEEAVEEKPVVEAEAEQPKVDQASTSVPFYAGIIDTVKANLLYVAGGLVAFILIIGLVLFRKRGVDQEEDQVASSQEAFPEFEDIEEEQAEAQAEAREEALIATTDASEDITDTPASSDETLAPEEAEAPPPLAATTDASMEETASPEEPEEDLLADVNVFLAYEQFDQAEEFVRNVIANDPDNPELHLKLLEVFYAANNKKAYEDAARDLRAKVDGQGEYWDMALAMWQELSPNRALFAEPVAGEEEEGTAQPETGGIVDITGEESGGGDKAVLDVTAAADLSEDISDVEAEDKQDLEFAMDLDTSQEKAEPEDILDVTAAVDLEDETAGELSESETGEESLDFSLDEEPAEVSQTEQVEDEDVLDITGGTGSSLDFDISEGDTGSQESSLDASTEESDEIDLTLGLGTTEEEASENSLDFSVDEPSADESSIEISEESGEAGTDDNALEFSVESEVAEEAMEKAKSSDDLDFSLDTESEEETTAGVSDDDVLDITGDTGSSLDLEITGDAKEEVTPDESAKDEQLDKSTNVSNLLDVTAAVEYENENDTDLLDVTTTVIADDGEKPPAATGADENALDFDISMDDTDSALDTLEEEIEGLEVKATDSSAAPGDVGEDSGLDFDISQPDDNSQDDTETSIDEIDLDKTTQFPDHVLSKEEEDDEQPTVFVPKSSNTEEQSDEDEIGTQLDLAKAYIELGDHANAETILDEIIAVGNEQQRQEAEELKGQIS